MIVAGVIYLMFGGYALLRLWDDLVDDEPERTVAMFSIVILWGPLLVILLAVVGARRLGGKR